MIITLPKPPSVNHLYGYNRYTGARYVKEKGLAWFTEAGLLLRSQYKDSHTGEVAVNIKIYYCGRYDWDNGAKATSDLLQKVGIVIDDDQIMDGRLRKVRVPHRVDQKMELEISPLE